MERSGCTLKPVDTAAALARGSTTRPLPPQPWARALPLLLGSGPSRLEATRQPSGRPPKAADLRPNPLTGKVERELEEVCETADDFINLAYGRAVEARDGLQ